MPSLTHSHVRKTYMIAALLSHLGIANSQQCFNNSDIQSQVIPARTFYDVSAFDFHYIPGLAFPGTPENTSWQINQVLYNDNTTQSSKSRLMSSFFIQIFDNETLSTPDLPYTGCAIIINLATTKTPKYVNDSCDGTVTPACSAFLKQTANQAALSYIGKNETTCSDLAQSLTAALPGNCSGEISSIHDTGSLIFGNPKLDSLATNPGGNCSADIADGGWDSAWIFQNNSAYVDGNGETELKAAAKVTTPVLLVGWADGNGNSSAGAEWADERLVCLYPSKGPNFMELNSAGRLVSWGKWGVGMSFMVGLVAMF